MKQIKFRAWDKEEKWMIDFDLSDLQNGHVGKREVYVLDMPILQYTGLKDKNGKEIYEGDIAKNKFNVIGLLEFDKGQQRIIWKTKEYPVTSWSHKFWKFRDEFEVIGNIYENPELLK